MRRYRSGRPGPGSGNRLQVLPDIRTLKENLLWVRHFATVAELVEALREFRRRYNAEWLIERHGFRAPSQARLEIAAAG